MNGKKKIATEYGEKTVVGIADLIDRETGAGELLEACKMALNERIKMFIDPADDLLSCTLNAAIAAAEGRE